MEPKEIVRKFETLWSARKTVEQQWQAIEQYIAPYTGKFFKENSGEHGIEWHTARNIYDATAVQAHIQLAASLHGSLTNPAIKWFGLQWRDTDLHDNHAAKTWIENAGDLMFHELQDSNFNLEANNVYKGLTSYATSVITGEANAEPQDEWQGLNFTSIPLKQAYFEPDDKGQCLNFYRHMQWRASKIVAKFGKENLPDKILSAFESAEDTSTFDIIFCVYTRTDKLGQKDATLRPENRPYGWCYVLRHGHDDKCLQEGGYYEMPAYVARWDVTDESMWGNGPAHYALADILTLNRLVELDIRSREKVIDPAILYQERALVKTLDLGPGAQNAVRDPTQIVPFESAARFDAVESSITRLQMAVQRYFYIDQLELKDSPAMTATEVSARMELMQRMLASTVARLKEDFLDPLLQRVFNIMFRAGLFGEPPEGVEVSEYDIQYVGPLNRAMKFDQAASIERWITQLQLIAQAGEDAAQVLLVPDYDAIARGSAEQLNLPTKYTRPKEDVENDLNRQRNQQARQASADAAAQEAAAAKDLGQAQQLAEGDQNIATGP